MFFPWGATWPFSLSVYEISSNGRNGWGRGVIVFN